ncbi:polymorphic toxin-type HINT domain-containing protein [Amycolatopsis solani]|uniref:polymorphic toxin-type HINT domain-containing protein n=1 Tax=Amycolatopsis solani TaxID=3028615 RepID=UPI0025B014DD|nr:polymorphic toxin-type HINT domain-containing protein [Amycolatopsis sp. MEP2-6]
MLTAALTANAIAAPPAVAAEPKTASAAVTTNATPDSDRAKVLRLWQFGGPATRRDAAAALTGTDADVTRFLTTLKDPDASIDRTVQVSRMMSAGGVATRSAGQQALDAGTDDALTAFLDTGWETPHGIDLSIRVSQIMSAGGAEVRKAGQKALDAGTEDALKTFLDSGWQVPFGIDQTVKVSRARSAGGPEVKRVGQQALDAGTLDALNQFLLIDLPVAQARDAETASITQLVATAKAASEQAAAQTQQAKDESDRAVTEAAAAQKAAQEAKDAAAAAQGNASEATDAANRAAYAADQAAITARRAIGAANAATAAAHTAAVAASRAATAASQAGKAASHAYDAAAAALGDKTKAADANAAAQTARDAAVSATTAANAARSARTASQQAKIAGQAATDAANQSRTAAQAATDAANASAAAGADARQAQAAAARARAQAAHAVAAAQASQSWADQAGTAAGQAADAADAAAANATAAANAAAAAAVFAGNAAEAAQKATDHANAATAAANTAVTAAQQASQIAQVARKADDDRIALAGQQADDAAQAAAAAYATRTVPPRWDLDQASTWDADTNHLIAEATTSGTARATVISDARKVALKLADTGGSWVKAASLTAIAASDDEAIDFITTGLTAAAGQDDRVILAQLADAGTAGFKTAAAAALAGSDVDVRNFLRSRDYPGRLQDDTLQVSQIMSAARTAGRTVVVQHGQNALDAGTDKALRDFIDTGQYVALQIDDQVKVAQVQSAARAAGSREVVAGAQAALDGPPTLAHEFLTVGQFTAARRDQNTAAHNAAVDSLLAQAASAAATATHDANEAQAAAARARNAADEAAHYADQAATAAAQAADAANQAQDAANRAAGSAQQAQASANTAAAAAATATVAADKAGRSAAWAAKSAVDAAGYARDAATSAHNAYNDALSAGKSAKEAADAAHTAWDAVAKKVETEKQQVIEQRKQSCQPAMRTASSLAGYSTEDCILLITGTQADKDRILHHLQDLCRQLNPQGSLKTNLCLDPHNLLNPNFQARYPDQALTNSGADPVDDIFVFIGISLLTAACEGVCDVLALLRGASADLGAIDGLETLAGMADVTAGGRSFLDVIGAEANAELGQAAELATEATARQKQLTEFANKLSENPIACLPNSFVAGTQVLMADRTTKSIEDVKPGEEVLNGSPGDAKVQSHAVEAVHVTDDDSDFIDVTISTRSSSETITATAHHLFWNSTTRAWTAAADLHRGQQLDMPGEGRATIANLRRHAAHARTYNLTIANIHTFYVVAGSVALLVHNGARCIEDLGNGLYRYDDGSIRTADGKWAGTTGANVGADVEKAVWDEFQSRGYNVVRGRVYCVGNGVQIRVYDGALDIGNGKYIGIEVKSGSAVPSRDQKMFDAWVQSGNTAKGVGQASGFDIVDVVQINR